MNASFHLDYLHILDHLTGIMQIHTTAQGTTNAANPLPKTANTTHFSMDGKQTASKSSTSFLKLKLSPEAKISGGSLQHVSKDIKDKILDTSAIHFAENGLPSITQTSINHRFKGGIYKKLIIDMSAVQWANAANIHSGQVKITTSDGTNNNLKSEGCMNYDKETLLSSRFTHYACSGSRSLSGYTEADYANTRFLGTKIIGGSMAIVSKNPANSIKSSSQIHLSGTGNIKQIVTENLDAQTGNLTSKVNADFSKVQFSPLNKIQTGEAQYLVNDAKGKLQSQTTVSFDNEVICHSITHNFDKEKQVTNKVLVDYKDAKFNNDLKVVNSSTNSQVLSPDDKQISKTQTQYDKHGNKILRKTNHYNIETGEVVSSVTTDYANVIFDHQHKPMSGHATITTTYPNSQQSNKTIKTYNATESLGTTNPNKFASEMNDNLLSSCDAQGSSQKTTNTNEEGQIASIIETLKRQDGTTQKITVTNIQNGRPASSSISTYATNGTTIIHTVKLDLTHIGYDANSHKLSGAVKTNSFFAGLVLSATGQLLY